ncbi:MAG: slipin family protein [Puniceicoccales bacterium]
MILIKQIHVPYEHYGLVFRNGQFVKLLTPGDKWIFDPRMRTQVIKLRQDAPWISIPVAQLRQLRASEKLGENVAFVDLNDNQRALVWLDGRFEGILGSGLYAYWTTVINVRIEIVDIREIEFTHENADTILQHADAKRFLHVFEVDEDHAGLIYVKGALKREAGPGRYAFWKNTGVARMRSFDLREKVLDVSGQDIMTADKVTLRLNAVLTYRITDIRKAAETVENVEQALYRELQLIIRAEVGGRTLDALLSDKSAVAAEAFASIRQKAATYGLEVMGMGIRDVILPGDMKELLNQVIEAEKAAQANVIKRREETAAMRSQLNTAKLIEQNPTLLRLRELESLEKIVEKSNLQIFVGDGQGMTDRIMKLI